MPKVIFIFLSILISYCVYSQPTTYEGPETSTVFFRLFDGENEIQIDKIDTSMYSIELYCDSVKCDLEIFNNRDTAYPNYGLIDGLTSTLFELIIIKKNKKHNDTMRIVYKDLLPSMAVGIYIHFIEGSYLFEREYFFEKMRKNKEFPISGNSALDITPDDWSEFRVTK